MEQSGSARVKAPPPALAPPSRFSNCGPSARASSAKVRCLGSRAGRLGAGQIKAALLRLSARADSAAGPRRRSTRALGVCIPCIPFPLRSERLDPQAGGMCGTGLLGSPCGRCGGSGARGPLRVFLQSPGSRGLLAEALPTPRSPSCSTFGKEWGMSL